MDAVRAGPYGQIFRPGGCCAWVPRLASPCRRGCRSAAPSSSVSSTLAPHAHSLLDRDAK